MLLCALLAVACSTKSATTPAQACSTGPAYSDATSFSYVGPGGGADAPLCTPRCAYDGGVETPGFYSVEALPSGACTSEGATCGLEVRIRCCGGSSSVQGPVNGMRCTCTRGTWSCGIESQGAATCGTCQGDGAVDAKSAP